MVKGWSGQPLQDKSLWYQNYAVTPVLPNAIKVTLNVKIIAVSYPLAGLIGFIEKDQEPPSQSIFNP